VLGPYSSLQDAQGSRAPCIIEPVRGTSRRFFLSGRAPVYAAAARFEMSIPITFRRRLSALKAKVFVSCIV